MLILFLSILVAIALDRAFAGRKRPAVWAWYGEWMESIESRLNAGVRSQGVSAVALAIVPVLIAIAIASLLLGQIAGFLGFLFDVFVLYLCVDVYRLGAQAESIAANLDTGDVAAAAAQLSEMTEKPVGDTREAEIAHGTVEAVLKQANSAVVAPIFWFIVLGPVGAALQRMAVAVDHLWGHRIERYAEFGWAAARLSDFLNWLPARITALSYAIMGSFEDALDCWRKKSATWADMNSGPLLASGFGALHMDVCGEGVESDRYGRITFTSQALADSSHVRRVIALVWRVMLFWLFVGALMSVANAFGLFGI
jgi:adenosylcobinamide-phosphate synthase